MKCFNEFLKVIRRTAIRKTLQESRMDLEPSFFSTYGCASYLVLISGFRNLEKKVATL